ncbi:MAG: CRISPR-associated endonuclease Cas1 [Methanothrix sp.]|uniref:CRISPR-associated endonuclease Cas4g/Cas1g n=1 Tax=Methanothrix sp. TaxID=90426 RepID=UPI0025FADBE4|nr:CRISPR-associated endonuclease Cas1 [Methanothrix sp.]MCQ8903237.1 CRISPR-associated endonuclease Cas1 [Methanothrix sp.]
MGGPDLIPARMLNEFAYCPRLCYIEWIQGEFIDSSDTTDGRFQHRRVDLEKGCIKDDEHEPIHARSVYMTAPEVGLACRIDLLEGDGFRVTPVDYKRGEVPEIPEKIYEPDRVQLCAQCLVLRENGFECVEGIAYFIRSRKRVAVKFDDELVKRTKDLIAELRRVAERGIIPPPLKDSPKCVRCSIASICLPDEVNLLRKISDADETETAPHIRRLLPDRDDAKPVYVIGQGHTVRKKGDRLEIWNKDEKVGDAKLREISQLSLYGGVEITTPAMVELMQRCIPVIHFSYGGWFHGICIGTTHKNVELRIRQYQSATDPERALLLARKIIAGKIRNCRTLIRRNDSEVQRETLVTLARLAKNAESANSADSLLGIEGAAAEVYFSRLGCLLKGTQFSFENRNKRPPRDPVNAVLSYLYAVLVKDVFVTLLAVGFDPYLGFYHRPRYGRPALALDMMEEFRPLIADSVALTLFNNKELSKNDFQRTGIGISLTSDGKRTVIEGYERRMETEIRHPLFGYKVSYRRVLEIQARLLARMLSGEIREYPPFCTR